MRTIILVMLITVPAFAQDQSQVVTAACGPKNRRFYR